MRFNNGAGINRSGSGLGGGGFCICPECNTQVKHQQGKPCYKQSCPNCGSPMIREGTQSIQQESNQPSSSKRRIASIDLEKCIGCGDCLSSCPFDAIEMRDGLAHVIEDKCKGCMACRRSCPVQAIS